MAKTLGFQLGKWGLLDRVLSSFGWLVCLRVKAHFRSGHPAPTAHSLASR